MHLIDAYSLPSSSLLPITSQAVMSVPMLTVEQYQTLITKYQQLAQESLLERERDALNQRVVECVNRIAEIKIREKRKEPARIKK